MRNLEIIWISLAVTMTTATQLRPGSLPIGIGELMVLIWILISTFRISNIGYHLVTPTFKTFLLFWIVSLTCMMVGLSIAKPMGLAHSVPEYDFVAFIFAFIFSIFLAISEKFYRETDKIVLIVISTITLFLFILFNFPFVMPFVNTWYGGVRFAGWTKNPNQTALILSMIPFLSLHLFNQSKNKLIKIWCSILIICCLILGIATQSDALILGWAIGFNIILLISFYLKFPDLIISNKLPLLQKNIYKSLIRLIIVLLVLLLISICFGEVKSGQNISLPGRQNGTSQPGRGDQTSHASERSTLWQNGIAATQHSPLFGLGPGAHSGTTGPFLDFESHNTFIDWASCTGIVGLLAYVSLLLCVLCNAWRKGLIVLVSSVIALVVFSSFHYVLRQPIFWFYLLSIMALSGQPTKVDHSLAQSKEKMKKMNTNIQKKIRV